jgi:hypothetical protein
MPCSPMSVGAEIDEVLRLAGGVLKAVYAHFSAGEPDLLPVAIGGAGDLINRLRLVHVKGSGAAGP